MSDDDLTLAHALADIAAVIAAPYAGCPELVPSVKADGTPVTAIDRLVEAALRDHLRLHRPGDAIVGEESGTEGTGCRRWYVDPIDGTNGFLAGQPDWRTLLAVEAAGIVQLGLASSPGLRRRWWAIRGGGTWTRDYGDPSARPVRLAVSRTRQLDLAVIATWPAAARMPGRLRAGLAALMAECRPAPAPDPAGTRHGALLVASGQTDAFLLAGAGPWDIAPMAVIVEEAGGRVSEVHGAILYSNAALHDQIRSRLT